MLLHLREHVVQAVTEFVKEGDDVVVHQQSRLAVHAFGKVAHQMRDWRLQAARVGAQPARAHAVHPGTATLAGAGGLVQVELTNQLSSAFNAVELNRRVPHGGGVTADRHFKQRLDNFEQARQHARRGEVLLDLLLAEGVARFLEALADEGPVPSLWVFETELCSGKVTQIGHVLLRIGARLAGQVTQKAHHLLG